MSELFTIEGEVIKGDQLGRQLGFPTANLRFDNIQQRKEAETFDSRFENQGLYYGVVTLLGGIELSIHNKPTLIFIGPRLVLGESKVVWEAHIITESSGELELRTPLPEFYGARLQITLLSKLRDNMHFDSLEALKVQMQQDLEQALLNLPA